MSPRVTYSSGQPWGRFMFSRPCLAAVGQIVATIVVTIVVTIMGAFVVEFVVAATEIRAHRKVIPWCSTAAPTDFGFQLNLEL